MNDTREVCRETAAGCVRCPHYTGPVSFDNERGRSTPGRPRTPQVSGTPSIVGQLGPRPDGSIPFSVEFNPPRDTAAEARLWRAAREFERMDPAFVSMTYGAGGSTPTAPPG